MKTNKSIKSAVATITLLAASPMIADHGSSIAAGVLGGGLGMMAGLALAEPHHHHCHEVIHVHERGPSRDWLEDQIERLEHKLRKANQYIEQLENEQKKADQYIQQLEDQTEKQEFEIHRLQKKIKQLEGTHSPTGKTEIILSAKSVS